MKQSAIFLIFAAVIIPHSAMAVSLLDPMNMVCRAGTTGLTQSECLQQVSHGQYCCPKCYQQTESTVCPDGWTLTFLLGSGTCTRVDNTIVASDSKGYKKQNYGTCSPTTQTVKSYLYEISATNKTDSNGLFYCNTI